MTLTCINQACANAANWDAADINGLFFAVVPKPEFGPVARTPGADADISESVETISPRGTLHAAKHACAVTVREICAGYKISSLGHIPLAAKNVLIHTVIAQPLQNSPEIGATSLRFWYRVYINQTGQIDFQLNLPVSL
jgi:hypothetical protein